ncbi:MAG TPA: FAD-dependent oxidoreductase, partial [Tepidisphaeraceae bacterium]|nr:FAD-dependent oxidoreductase [Tepidisphaeraceae bacterium]
MTISLAGILRPPIVMGFIVSMLSITTTRVSGNDLVVYTASPGGIMTAVAAARNGARVVVVEPTQHVGGIVAQGGLVLSDLGDETTIGGLAREFFARVEKHYADTYGPNSPQREHTKFQGYPGGCFEPRVAEMIFEQFLAEHPTISVVRGGALRSVQMEGTSIRAIVVSGPDGDRRIEGRLFADASYTGDLLAMAGVSFHIGRESRQ